MNEHPSSDQRSRYQRSTTEAGTSQRRDASGPVYRHLQPHGHVVFHHIRSPPIHNVSPPHPNPTGYPRQTQYSTQPNVVIYCSTTIRNPTGYLPAHPQRNMCSHQPDLTDPPRARGLCRTLLPTSISYVHIVHDHSPVQRRCRNVTGIATDPTFIRRNVTFMYTRPATRHRPQRTSLMGQ